MEKLTVKEFNNGKGYSSYDMRDNLKELNLKDDIIINFAYTDYGGSFADRVFIQYMKENYKDNIIIENTYYYGKNAVLYGEVAREFWNKTENYLLGFEDIENYYFEKEYEAKNKCIDTILNDFIRQYDNEENPDIILDDTFKTYCRDFLYDKFDFPVQPSGYCDYSENEVFEAIESFLNDEYKYIMSKVRKKTIL